MQALQKRQRAISLILSLAVLSVLSVLSVSFVKLAMQDRDAARNYSLQVKAQQIASGGIERAVGELSRETYKRSYTNFTSDRWVFRTDNGLHAGYYPATTLEDAKYPSYPFDADEDGVFENGVATAAAHDLIGGRAISGMVADISASAQSTYGLAGGQHWSESSLTSVSTYKLRVRACNGKINLNSTQANFASLLNTLGTAIATDAGLADPVAGRGAAIIALRASLPGGAFSSFSQLETLLTADEINALREFVTLFTWVDATTMRPDPQVDPKTMPAQITEPRSPVDINSATKPVLRAIFTGLYGYKFRFVNTADVYMGAAIVIDEKVSTTALTSTQAGAIADAIIEARRTTPFTTWEQFYLFVDGLPALAAATYDSLNTLDQGQKHVIRANCNPNTLLARFNPNQVRSSSVDKMDLQYYSTELCFGSSGYFEIESLGEVYDRKGNIVARAEQWALVRVADFIRHTTQVDFETNRVANTRAVSFPENIADMGGLGSTVDGQIEALRPLSSTGTSFFAPFETTLYGTVGSLKAPQWDNDAKEEGISLFSGSDLAPDGMLSSRSLNEELGYHSDNLSPTTGTVEFWVKMRGDGVTGSNETLYYLVDTVNYSSTKRVIGHKLERWGDQITSARFFAGHPDGYTSPYALAMSEVTGYITSWQNGEWHHIAIVWYDTINHDLYIDGIRQSTKTTMSSSSITFRLGSNEPGDEFTIGGYEFYAPSAVLIYNRGNVITVGQNYRFSNSTIRDVRCYSTRRYSSASFSTPEAYDDNPSYPQQWQGKFVFALPYGVTLGALSWSEYQPRKYKSTTYNASATSPDTDVVMEYRVDGGAWTTIPTAPTSGGDGRGASINASFGVTSGSGSKLVEYRMTFTNTSGITPFNVTPIVDDVTLSYRIPPQFLRYDHR